MSDKKYPSIYSPNSLVTCAQYLSEYIIKRQSRLKNIDLPTQFWKSDKIWEKEYLRQLRAANGLLKLYSPEAISAALRSKQGKKVISLGANFLDDMIKSEQYKIDLLKTIQQDDIKEVEEVQQEEIDSKQRPEFNNKKSIKNKLMDL